MNKVSKKLVLIFLVLFISFAFFINFSIGGFIEHNILSPFNHSIAIQKQEINSELTSESTQTSIANSYKNIDEYDDATEKPFCMIGGQYRVNVTLDVGPVDDSNGPLPVDYTENFKLYYCKTTQDLLKNIQIPSSWENDNLTVYCNDGARINKQDVNFDFITSSVQTYKSCILKNNDKKHNSSILYGYDVGNKIVDHNSEYYFDLENKQGALTDNLEFDEIVNKELKTAKVFAFIAQVPYKSLFSVPNDVIYVPRNKTEAKDYLMNHPIINLSSESQIEHLSNELGGHSASNDSYSKYKIYNMIEYNVTKHKFHTSDKREFYFTYDPFNNFYSLTQTNKTFDINISDVFDVDKIYKTSRVAFLKKIGNKNIYGYEKVSNAVSDSIPYNTSIKPVYILELEGFNGFNQQVCMDSLKKYKSALNYDSNNGIKCIGTQIQILTENLYSKDSQLAFHLFKNIATSIE
jgi:hypothetical protein